LRNLQHWPLSGTMLVLSQISRPSEFNS
jgi:hypothetical protein